MTCRARARDPISRVLIDRITAKWCICLANMGKCSQICPSPLVRIGLNGPPVAVPGFKSHRSIVDGPPPIQSRIVDVPSPAGPSGPAASVRARMPDETIAEAAPATWDTKLPTRHALAVPRAFTSNSPPTSHTQCARFNTHAVIRYGKIKQARMEIVPGRDSFSPAICTEVTSGHLSAYLFCCSVLPFLRCSTSDEVPGRQ